MSKTPLVVLLWTLPEEPEFAAALARLHDPFWVVPLRYPALLAARRILPAERILTPAQLVSPGLRRAIYDRTVQRVNALWSRLRAQENEPWLDGLQYYQSIYLMYAAEYWQRLLDQLPLQDPGSIRHYVPFSRIFLNGYVQGEMRMLEAHLAARHSTAGSRQPLLDSVAAGLGALCNHAAHWLTRSAPACERSRVPTVFFGLQGTDWLAQAPLVGELAAGESSTFRWLVPAQDRLEKMKDELEDNQSSQALRERTDSFPLDNCGYFCNRPWLHRRMRAWSERQVAHRLHQALSDVLVEPELRAVVGPLAASIAEQNPDLRLKYLALDGVLRQYDPQTLVLNSTIDEVAFAVAWARANRRRLVLLPHGVHSILDYRFHWSVDCAGLIGSYTERQVAAMDFPGQQRVCVGGVHVARLGQQAARVSAEARSAQTVPPQRALFLLTNNYGVDFPDAVEELEADLGALVGSLTGVGWTLALRCHPRSTDAVSCRMMVRALQERGLSVEWSDARESLAADLARSGLAITRTWDGASVTALYAGVPLLGWLPRPTHAHAQRFLAELPFHAERAETVGEELGAWASEPGRRAALIDRQAPLLAEFVAEPYAAPYDRALSLLRQELARAKGAAA